MAPLECWLGTESRACLLSVALSLIKWWFLKLCFTWETPIYKQLLIALCKRRTAAMGEPRNCTVCQTPPPSRLVMDIAGNRRGATPSFLGRSEAGAHGHTKTKTKSLSDTPGQG